MAPDGQTFGAYHGYGPSDLLAAYNVDKVHAEGITGKGQTIVIVDSYGSPTALEDLKAFSQAFGLPEPNLTIIYPDGKPTYSKAMHGIQANWGFETSLDLQWAHAMAPDARLVLIAANPAESQGVQGFPSMFKGMQYAVENFPGAVISQSFGVTEQSFHSAADEQVAKFDKVYQNAVARRCTVLASSGDTGTADGDKQGRVYPFPTVSWPNSDPLVTSVGGTWLQSGWKWDPQVSAETYYAALAIANATGVWGEAFSAVWNKYLNFVDADGITEAVWREDPLPAATGGGLSTLFATPAFQQGLPQGLLQGRRGVPDISCNAAVNGGVMVYVSYLNPDWPWQLVGGTSAACPEIAGMIALANQLRADKGKPAIGYLNPVLYTLPARDFNDIVPQTFGEGEGVVVVDNNVMYGSGIDGCKTTAQWDLTTGFGSPNAYWLVHDLADKP
jgi:subtilase family serine protease